MSELKDLLTVVPQAPDFKINWQIIENGVMRDYAAAMKKTQQNPVYHAEGNVWIHTKMVCECLVQEKEFKTLAERQRQELFLAALFHDVGKIPTTRLEDGDWTSPNHSAVGANMVREKLWREYGVCGTKDLQNFRETICLLIRYHMMIPHLIEADDPEQRLIRTAADGKLANDFSLRLLTALSMADSDGRISNNRKNTRETLLLMAEIAKEAECYDKPKDFVSHFTEFAFLSGRNVTPETELYNDTVCEVIMMCGLPGTGKDTYIRKSYPDHPIVSLDDIRREYDISPSGNQQEVIRIAKERAKQLLRQKKSFVWNATSITPDIRSKMIALFQSYNAYTRIVYLETDYKENLYRNKSRKSAVAPSVIDKMLERITPPERFEAHEVDWICI